jgi:septum formation protein
MGYEFETCAPDVDENVEGKAAEVVTLLARKKARAAAAGRTEGIVIASDTLVSLDGAGLGKPKDAAEAKEMLFSLSGREHDVYTGVCAIDVETGREMEKCVRTGVQFRELTEEEIDEYVATGEPMDKAGAYAIQGGAGGFVTWLDGSFENVVGFPVDEVDAMLKKMLSMGD